MSIPLFVGMAFLFFAGGVAGTLTRSLSSGLRLAAVMLVGMGLFTGVNQAANALYYASDITFYLMFPVDAVAIVWSRMARLILPSFAGDFALALSFSMGWSLAAGSGPAAVVLMVVSVACVTLSLEFSMTILVILLMRLSRLARDKDRFSKLFGAMETLLTIAFGLWLQPLVVSSASVRQGVLRAVASVGDAPAFLAPLGVLCPPILLAEPLFSGSMELSLAALVGMLALTIAMAAVLCCIASHLYLPAVKALGAVGTAAGRGEVSDMRDNAAVEGPTAANPGAFGLARLLRPRGHLRANLMRDWLQTVRTAYFFNKFILAQALVPLYFVCMMALAALTRLQGEDGAMALRLLRLVVLGQQGRAFLTLVALALVATTCFSTVAYMTAVSRDGRDFAYLRSLPMDWTMYLLGKFLPLLALAALPLLAVLLVVLAALAVPASDVVYLAFLLMVDSTLVGTLTFGVGARFPRLSWESEEQIMEIKAAIAYIIGGAILALTIIVPQAVVAIAQLSGLICLSHVALAMTVVTIALVELTPALFWVFFGCARRLARRTIDR